MEKQTKKNPKKVTRIRKYKSRKKEILLREYRESIGLTQFELGQLAGVNARTISAYETGTRKPSSKVGIKLSRVFNVRLEEIFPNLE